MTAPSVGVSSMSTRPPSAPLPLPPIMIEPPLASISPLMWTPPLPGSVRGPPLRRPPAPGADIELPPRRSIASGPAMLTLPVPGSGVTVPPAPAEATPSPPLATNGTRMAIVGGGARLADVDGASRAADHGAACRGGAGGSAAPVDDAAQGHRAVGVDGQCGGGAALRARLRRKRSLRRRADAPCRRRRRFRPPGA